jgi:hypothetical protein
VRLVAVSKTKPVELLQAAYDAGQRDFGENYVQELVDKQAVLPTDIRWHFIGHLQTNKVKYIVPFVHLIHGVDSLKLLKEINKQAEKCGRVVDVLLQIYIAREESKFGWEEEECLALFRSEDYAQLKHVRIVGMMGMASNTDNEDIVRTEYSRLKQFYDLVNQNIHPLQILSAGMSGDYQLAMQLGSNMVRIGSSIFGQRIYT